MCPTCEPNASASHQNGSNGTNGSNGSNGHTSANGSNGANGTESTEGFTQIPSSRADQMKKNPYAPIGDYLSNTSRFKIIESTLREGEQFANAYFDTETKIEIARALDDFGVDYIELTSPAASEQSRLDCIAITKLGLKAKILTHIRCHMDDARIAVETGVDGVDVVIGTSAYLRKYSHGKSMEYIKSTALEVIQFVKSKGLEVRFSSEDSFRSDLADLLSLYAAVDRTGAVCRVGVADTVGCATGRQVYDLVRTLRGVVSCDIETHFHDDTCSAVSNAYEALSAGATHIDTSVLGIGERVGITSLGGLMARMITIDRDYVLSKYKVHKLKALEDLVASKVEVHIPFNNPITGFCAFTHKAGIHAKAILANPSTYEILSPSDFGLTRYIHMSSRLTGWNSIKSRAEQLGLDMTDEQYKLCTAQIKALADIRKLSIEDTDLVINNFYDNVKRPGQSPKPLLESLTSEETQQLKAKVADFGEGGPAEPLVKDTIDGPGITNGKAAIQQLVSQ